MAGHVPRKFSCVSSLFVRRGGTINPELQTQGSILAIYRKEDWNYPVSMFWKKRSYLRKPAARLMI